MGVKTKPLWRQEPCYYTDPRRCVGFFCLKFTIFCRLNSNSNVTDVFPTATSPTPQKP